MKRTIVLLCIALNFINCKKNNSACIPVSALTEAPQLQAFCVSNGISYTIDSNGIYYQVINQGTGMKPSANSLITVTYTAYTLDGNIVEDKSTTPVTSNLSQFIEGWRIAIPYIQKGGRIKMVIPSSLCYSCTGISGVIPPNTPLYYDVVLSNVQ